MTIPSSFQPVIQRLTDQSEQLLGMRRPSTTVLRHLPRVYSELLHVRFDESNRSIAAFLKISRLKDDTEAERRKAAERIDWTIHTLDALRARMAGDGLGVIRPIAAFPDLLAVVTEEANGVTLLDYLQKLAWRPAASLIDDARRTLERVGAWLAWYRQTSPPSVDVIPVSEIRDYLDLRLRLLAENPRAPFSREDRSQLLNAFDAAAQRLDSDPRRLTIHADLALANVLVHESEVTVLDFAVPATGTVLHDIAHLHMQIGLLAAKPHYRPQLVTGLQEAMLRGYQPGLRADDPLFELMSLQHVVCHMKGLVEGHAGLVSRAYNWHIVRRHRRWLSAFVERHRSLARRA